MAKQKKIWEIMQDAGFEPIENEMIIVSYAPENLSDAVIRFLRCSNQFFILQICRDTLILIPFGKMTLGLKREVAFEIPFTTIKNIQVEECGLNYTILIETDHDIIRLSAQQKEISELIMAGLLCGIGDFEKNCYKEHLDYILEALKGIVSEA